MAIIQDLNILSMKFYSGMGAITGFGYAFLVDTWESILLTFILGFVGAVAGGLGKLFINYLNSKIKYHGKKKV